MAHERRMHSGRGLVWAVRMGAAMIPATTPLPNAICPLCGGANQCAPARVGTYEVDCWCRTTPVSAAALARIAPDRRGMACLCPRCAAQEDGQDGQGGNAAS